MTLNSPYIVTITATHSNYPTYTSTKIVHIDIAYPAVQISYVEGCNTLFDSNNPITLTAQINTNLTKARFNWYCIDQ